MDNPVVEPLHLRLVEMGIPDGPDDYDPDPAPAAGPEGIVALGHDKGVFYYLSRSARQVYALSADRHSRNSLMAMASVPHYWQRSQFIGAKGGIDWEAATDDLMRKCRDVGIFDTDRLRGRGAWMDEGRSILHIGDRLLVDGEDRDLALEGSRFVYEAARSLADAVADPLPTSIAHKLVEICKSLRWERPISGVLLAGFIATAAVCGGLKWRSSIWLTGGAGSGKSWAYERIIAAAIGRMALQVGSKTSEAGIRQTLGSDARPVLFDEAEKEDHHAAARMQGVMDLVRQSSSEGGAEIIKGTQNQAGSKRYRIRSQFAFVSINVGLEHHADETRITVLSLREPERGAEQAEAFAELDALVADTITPEFAAGLVARSVRLLPIIRANAETFARAISDHLGNRRIGDQLGTLLAGAYSLHSEREITPEQAAQYIQREDLTSGGVADARESDQAKLLTRLTQHRLRVTPGNGAAYECTVGRLILAAGGRDEQISPDIADRELRQIGIRANIDGAYVSNSHPALALLLAGTPWVSDWARSLARLPGAVKRDKAMRFGPGHVAKAVWVSIITIDPSEEEI